MESEKKNVFKSGWYIINFNLLNTKNLINNDFVKLRDWYPRKVVTLVWMHKTAKIQQ